MKKELAVFGGHEISRIYDEQTETWWFSVVDIIRVLTQQPDQRRAQSYWTTLKNRLKSEGSQVVTNCNQLKMPAADGKNYLTDAATAETLLRRNRPHKVTARHLSRTFRQARQREGYAIPSPKPDESAVGVLVLT